MTANLTASLTDEERIGLEWPMASPTAQITAMILWEAFIDPPKRMVADIDRYRAKVGTVAARHDLLQHVAALHIGWHVHAAPAEDPALAPFDWGFAPWFLANCLTFDPAGWIDLRTDWLDLCRAQ